MRLINDNSLLSYVGGRVLDISEHINNLTSEQFEQVCINLLKKIKPTPFKITGTRYVKDGGKDIIGTVDDVPYEIWAECKKHSRALGLDDISKNVVLVISNKVRELFFFSTSNITLNAQRHISIVADKHDFSVAFHYGEKLFNEIKMLSKSENNQSSQACDDLLIEYYLTQYKNAEKYTITKNIILKRDNYFFIDFFLHNNSPNSVKITNISYSLNHGIKLSVNEADKQFEIQPFTDKYLQIRGEIIDSRHIQQIPCITVEYINLSLKNTKLINCGTVDARQLIYFPLIGNEPNKFLLQKIRPILSVDRNNDSYLIDIRGESGNGKSRMLKEICLVGREYHYRIIQFDGMKTKDISIIRQLICKLLYITYNKGNITFSSKNILNILVQRGSNANFAETIYSFVFQSKNDDEILYFVKQAVLYFLIKPLFDEKIMLVFDNVQEMNNEVIDMLSFLISGIYEQSSNCICVLSTNTEFVPERNKEKIAELFSRMDLYPNDFHILYKCNELKRNDAVSLYIHALNTENLYFIDKLIQKSGCRPFDIIMLIKYLQEEEIITWQGMSMWYIADFAKLNKLLINIPDLSSKMIGQRYKMQRKNCNANYWKTFNLVIKSLLYFNGYLPVQFIEDMGIEDEVMEQVVHSLFIKYDEYNPIVLFFHDNIHRYFSNKKTFSIDTRLAGLIKKWFSDNEELYVTGKDSILYKVYIDLSDIQSAKEYGIMAIKNNYELKNYEEVSNIGRQLILNKNITLSSQDRFKIMYMIANSERERVNHEDGAELFYEAFNFLHENSKSINLTNDEYNQFMHACVNSQINASRPNVALEILKTFESSSTLNPFYKFIVHNRYSVALLASGDITSAHNRVQNAISIADDMCDDYLLSIAYSDLAFIYLNAFENGDKVIEYFSMAFKKGAAPTDFNRYMELLQQNALCLCLNDNIADALSFVNNSIELGEQIHNTFLTIKAMTLKSTIYAYNQDYKNAINILNKVIIRCDENHSLSGKIKAYTNLSAIHIIQNDNKRSRDCIDIAFNLFKRSKQSVVKYKPLFYNYITIYSKIKEYEALYAILVEYNDETLLRFLDDIYNNNGDNKSDYGVLRLDDAVFSY